jgi:hypothetical protein
MPTAKTITPSHDVEPSQSVEDAPPGITSGAVLLGLGVVTTLVWIGALGWGLLALLGLL